MGRLTEHSFFKFLLVGVGNTLLSAAIMFLLYNMAGMDATLSSAVAFAAGAVMSFFLNRAFTFRSREQLLPSAVKFAVNVAVLWAISYLWLQRWLAGLLLARGLSLGLADNASMLVSMGFYTVLNYLGQRFFAFRSGASC